MATAVRLREDYSAEALRSLAKRSKDANRSRRLLSLAAVREAMDCHEPETVADCALNRCHPADVGFIRSPRLVGSSRDATALKERVYGDRQSRKSDLDKVGTLFQI